MSDEKGPGGMDLNNILGQVMEQARNVQGRVTEVQDKVKTMTAEGGAGGGLVTVTASGDGRIRAVKIDPVAVDKRDIEMLEDLIVAGCNDALRRAGELVEQEMGAVTGGLDMGALGNLFGGGR